MARLRSLLPLLLLGPIVVLGCKATTQARSGPDAVLLAPDYANLKLESLAYLGTASLSPDPIALTTVEGLLRSYLTGGQQKFLIADVSTADIRAQKAGVGAELAQAIHVWKDKQTVDRYQLQALGQKLGFDGFVVATIDQWREEKVDWTSEGTSFTEVGLTLKIYEARTGVLAWQGKKMERRDSAYYRHGTGGTGVYSEEGVERTERADKLVPPPPPPEEVAESVIQALMEGLPPKPGAGAAPAKPSS